MVHLPAVDPSDATHLFVGQVGSVDVGYLGGEVVEDVGRGLVQLVGVVVEDPPVGQRVESVWRGHQGQVHHVALLHHLHRLGLSDDLYRHWDTVT